MKKFIYRVWLGSGRRVYAADSNQEFLDMFLGNERKGYIIKLPKEKLNEKCISGNIRYQQRSYHVDIIPVKENNLEAIFEPIEQLPLMMGLNEKIERVIKERLAGETNLYNLLKAYGA